MMTYSGVRVEPAARDGGKYANTPPIRDIAIQLHRIVRYGGAVREWWSVLQHSIAVAKLLKARGRNKETILYGLLHDAHEAITSDIPSFWKSPDMKPLQQELDERIFGAYLGARIINVDEDAVHKADRDMLYAESLVLGPIGITQFVDAPPADAMTAFTSVYLDTRTTDPREAGGPDIHSFLDLFQQLQGQIFSGYGVT